MEEVIEVEVGLEVFGVGGGRGFDGGDHSGWWW